MDSEDRITVPNAQPGHRFPRSRTLRSHFRSRWAASLPRRGHAALPSPAPTLGRVGASVATFAVVGATLLVPAPASAQPRPCAPATVTTAVAARIPLLDRSDNVGLDAAGNLWVSRVFRNVVERYDPAGNLTASVPVTFPGAIRPGPDGMLYVNFGNLITSALLRTGGVVRFDPAAPAPVPEVFVDGIGMTNGAAFDHDGNLYVTDADGGIARVRRDGSIDTEWTAAAPQAAGFHGVAAHGDSLYVTVPSGPAGRVLRLPIADPTATTPVADLATGPGDVVFGPDDLLYVTTEAGRLVRVDPAGAGTCAIDSPQPITAVALSAGTNPAVFAGTEGGDVQRIRLG